jgi:hypothetical protein
VYLLGVDSLRVVRLRIALMDDGFVGRAPNNNARQAFAWLECALIC